MTRRSAKVLGAHRERRAVTPCPLCLGAPSVTRMGAECGKQRPSAAP